VAPGVEYSAPGATLHWNVDGFYGLVTRTLGDAHNGATWIVYTQSVTAMGFDLHGYDGYPNDAVISVYDLADDLVFSGSVTGGVGATNTFFGYEHAAGIGRVTVDAQGSNYMMIDNHAYGVTSAAVPAPAAAPLLVAALGGLAAAARRRRRG
ncbi:MAG: hypothetical protein VX463_12130, partial [Pseudomonadota bacterium]|nr:hypothetical protein [Pseudomonadota bacterium]